MLLLIIVSPVSFLYSAEKISNFSTLSAEISIIYSLAGRGSFVGEFDISTIKEKAVADFDKAVKDALSKGFERKELCDRIMGGENND